MSMISSSDINHYNPSSPISYNYKSKHLKSKHLPIDAVQTSLDSSSPIHISYRSKHLSNRETLASKISKIAIAIFSFVKNMPSSFITYFSSHSTNASFNNSQSVNNPITTHLPGADGSQHNSSDPTSNPLSPSMPIVPSSPDSEIDHQLGFLKKKFNSIESKQDLDRMKEGIDRDFENLGSMMENASDDRKILYEGLKKHLHLLTNAFCYHEYFGSQKIDDKGIITAISDGNCLYHSVTCHLQLRNIVDSKLVLDMGGDSKLIAAQLRQDTVKKMDELYTNELNFIKEMAPLFAVSKDDQKIEEILKKYVIHPDEVTRRAIEAIFNDPEDAKEKIKQLYQDKQPTSLSFSLDQAIYAYNEPRPKEDQIKDIPAYFVKAKEDGFWGGPAEIIALSELYKMQFILTVDGLVDQKLGSDRYVSENNPPAILSFKNNNHFDTKVSPVSVKTITASSDESIDKSDKGTSSEELD